MTRYLRQSHSSDTMHGNPFPTLLLEGSRLSNDMHQFYVIVHWLYSAAIRTLDLPLGKHALDRFEHSMHDGGGAGRGGGGGCAISGKGVSRE